MKIGPALFQTGTGVIGVMAVLVGAKMLIAPSIGEDRLSGVVFILGGLWFARYMLFAAKLTVDGVAYRHWYLWRSLPWEQIRSVHQAKDKLFPTTIIIVETPKKKVRLLASIRLRLQKDSVCAAFLEEAVARLSSSGGATR